MELLTLGRPEEDDPLAVDLDTKERWAREDGAPDLDAKTTPNHYTKHGALSSVYIITHYGLGFELGNAIKYILRAGDKPGESEVDDLRKACWYVRRRLAIIDPENHEDPAAGR